MLPSNATLKQQPIVSSKQTQSYNSIISFMGEAGLTASHIDG